ncbi:hypothetical protein JAAARDRAFT_316323 [Jaapia argillacea MUCL 33604]|uniref:Uncharacterized protein n=1 Tax=Jaapia argillacea MUCL 33604 TaxID=933084 RepID=A0A067PMG9_9AGAM|nr:hypothetical protein JAAARDRAFT_316323 [Jaapia argillacea MUCL 33604]
MVPVPTHEWIWPMMNHPPRETGRHPPSILTTDECFLETFCLRFVYFSLSAHACSSSLPRNDLFEFVISCFNQGNLLSNHLSHSLGGYYSRSTLASFDLASAHELVDPGRSKRVVDRVFCVGEAQGFGGRGRGNGMYKLLRRSLSFWLCGFTKTYDFALGHATTYF